MTFEELKKDDWYKSRPIVIQQAIDILPPIHLYRLKGTGKQCFINSYEEPKSGELKDVTVTVQKTGVGVDLHPLLIASIGCNKILGLSLDDLEPWVDDI